MKVAIWNVRGLGGGRKEGMIRKFLKEKKHSLLGLVETKKSSLNRGLVAKFQGNNNLQWARGEVVNSARGLLCIWVEDFLEHVEVYKDQSWLGIKERLKNFPLTVHFSLCMAPM